jgi:hypothetical protein
MEKIWEDFTFDGKSIKKESSRRKLEQKQGDKGAFSGQNENLQGRTLQIDYRL